MSQDELKSKISELRERATLTQRELADRVGVTEATIANWERGRRAIDFIEKLIKLCDALQCEIKDLIERPSLDLREVNLANEDLARRDFSKADLQLANLSGANLEGIKLADAKLNGINLQAANLENADLRRSILEDANLTAANLKGCNLEGAILKNANLTNADLREANLRSANIEGAIVQSAMLMGADLRDIQGLSEDEAISENLPLVIGGIPDQDFEKLTDMYGKLSEYLQEQLQIEVRSYTSSTNQGFINIDQNYESTVTAFRWGNLDLAWLGGFTAIQAVEQVPEAKIIAQREIDQKFRTILIGNRDSLNSLGIRGDLSSSQQESLAILKKLCQAPKKLKFAFGGKSSTSGDLIPLHYLVRAGLKETCFQEVRFAGSHDATIRLVASGVYDVGALNQQVWESRLHEFSRSKIIKLWHSPPYQNYAWVVHPKALRNFDSDLMLNKIQQALLDLKTSPHGRSILDFFGSDEFIKTRNQDYDNLREIVRKRENDEAFFWEKPTSL
jgi:phosphonate transport system substrate-binding protein